MSAVLEAREPSARYLEALQPPLVQHFGLLAAAPGGVARLRELILALAVRGKLVAQQPSDTPASVLLARIAVIRNAHGRDRARRPPAASEDEQPYELPPSWAWTRVGEVGQVVGGGTPKSDVPEYWSNAGLPWLTPADLYGRREMRIMRGRRDISPEGLASSSAQLLPTGTVLFSSRAPIGYVAVAGVPLATNQGFKSCAPYLDGLSDYLYWHLKQLAPSIDASASGTTFKEISGADFARVVIAMPPLEEQARIVARVDELMRLCDALEAKGRLEAEQHARLLGTLLGTLTDSATPAELAANWQRVADHFDLLLDRPEAVDALEQTTLQLAVRGLLLPQCPNDEPATVFLRAIRADKDRFIAEGAIRAERPPVAISDTEKSFVLPEGWAWARLSEISQVIVDCPHSTPKFVDAGLLCLDTNSFKDGKLVVRKLRFVDQKTFDERVARLRPEPGDLVFAREGSVGESIIIPPGTVSCLGQRVMLFRLSQRVSNEFVRLTITSQDFLDALLGLHKGIGAKHVNVADMRNAVVPVPPLAEQRRIVARVAEIRRLCTDLRQRLADSQGTQAHLAEALVESATD